MSDRMFIQMKHYQDEVNVNQYKYMRDEIAFDEIMFITVLRNLYRHSLQICVVLLMKSDPEILMEKFYYYFRLILNHCDPTLKLFMKGEFNRVVELKDKLFCKKKTL